MSRCSIASAVDEHGVSGQIVRAIKSTCSQFHHVKSCFQSGIAPADDCNLRPRTEAVADSTVTHAPPYKFGFSGTPSSRGLLPDANTTVDRRTLPVLQAYLNPPFFPSPGDIRSNPLVQRVLGNLAFELRDQLRAFDKLVTQVVLDA